MFKKLVPVVALALLAGPVFAADAPATTPSGDQFALVLMRVKTAKGEQTRVRLEGTTNNHEKILVNILAQAENAAKGPTGAAQK